MKAYRGYQQQMPRNHQLSEAEQMVVTGGQCLSRLLVVSSRLFASESIGGVSVSSPPSVDTKEVTYLLVVKKPSIKHEGFALVPLLDAVFVHLQQTQLKHERVLRLYGWR